MSTTKIQLGDPYFIYVRWKFGFKHIWPCRGYDLKSVVAFLGTLTSVDSFEFKKVSEQVYTKTAEKGEYGYK
jgi:hypothetical protein